MSTDWMEAEVSVLFGQYDDYLEERLGYTPILKDIASELGKQISILDYGCGSGKVSRRMIKAGFKHVQGVDISQTTVDLANQHPDKGNSNYLQIQSGRLPFVAGTFDAAICCYVLINNNQKAVLLRIMQSIYKSLKTGGVCYVLDTNPDNTGIKYESFMNGDPQVTYHDGESHPVYLDLPNGDTLTLSDTHWDKFTYQTVMLAAGFSGVEMFEPTESTLQASQPDQPAPFVVFKAIKSV